MQYLLLSEAAVSAGNGVVFTHILCSHIGIKQMRELLSGHSRAHVTNGEKSWNYAMKEVLEDN